MALTQEEYDQKLVELQNEFDRKREKIMSDSYKEIDKAWKKYQGKLKVLTVV